MEITTSPYLQQLCQLLLGCCSSLLTYFFSKESLPVAWLSAGWAEQGLRNVQENCFRPMEALIMNHQSFFPAREYISNAKHTLSTAALLPSSSHCSLARASRRERKRGPAVPRNPIFCPVHWLAPSWLLDLTFIPRRGWDRVPVAEINSVPGEGNSDVPTYRFITKSAPLWLLI